MARETYPLTLSIAAALATALGLAAAALGIKWGSAPPPGDALPLAWLYVHLMLMLTWLVAWPGLALRPRRRAAGGAVWEATAIALGAIPAVAVAGFVSGIAARAAAHMLGVQLGAAMLMLGLVRARHRFPTLAAAGAGIVMGLTLAGPIAAFLWMQFTPQLGHGWFAACPLIAVGRAATGTDDQAQALWRVAELQALLGLLLMGVAGGGRDDEKEKAPGAAAPRA